MRRVLLVGLAALCVAGTWNTIPEENREPPELRDPLPFDHNAHAKTFGKVKLACIDCHPLGLSIKVDGEAVPRVEDLPKPLAVCHGCHRRMVKGAPLRAPGTCMLCHAQREDLKPPSHEVDWIRHHAAEARNGVANCKDCHESDSCVSCHVRRGVGARSPHPPAFKSFHGVEARLDPANCGTCHVASTCTSCHRSGKGPF